MAQPFVLALLALALVLPIIGATFLRLLAPRLTGAQLAGAAVLIFGVVFASVLLLARANIASLQVGELSLLLPVAEPGEEQPTIEALPTPISPAEASPIVETALPTAAPTSAPTPTPTATPTSAPPTATATPTPTDTPSPVPPTATAAPAARRTYVVKAGDTLRGIAEQFNVSVQALIDANNLTPQQADALRVGQELVIP